MPSGWHEVPFNKGVKILEGGMSDVEILAFLTNTEVDDIYEATDAESIYYLMSAFRFLRDVPADLEHPQMPRSIKIGGEYYIFPHVIYGDTFDLGNASVGQIKDMEMIVVNMGTEFRKDEEDPDRPFTQIETIKMCPAICAIYIQKIIDKKYDYHKATKLAKKLAECLSFKEMLHIGYFFLKRLADLNDGPKKERRKGVLIVRKLKRVFWSLTKRMDSIRR
jgi:hypothetical protein